MAAYLITAAVLIIYLVLAWFIGSWLHLPATAAWILRLLLWLIGLIGAGAFVWFYRKNKQATGAATAAGAGGSELDQRVSEALRRLRTITRAPHASFGDHPLVLVLGPSGSTKTSVIKNSGLDPDLLSGCAEQDGAVVPTGSANFFFTRQAVFVDAGASLEQGDLRHLVTRLQRSSMAGALRSGGQKPRVALVCIGCDCFQQGAAAAQARMLNSDLHAIAEILGSDCAVYVLFTKMDRVPGFKEYVQYLSKEEASQVLGVTLPMRRSGTGVYAEDETRRLSTAFDELFCSMAEKRTEFLAHENDAARLGAIYEFPRHVRKLRTPLVQFLVDLCRPSHMSANPLLRGFYFCGVRPIVVEDVVAPAVTRAPVADAGAQGATRMFTYDQITAAAARPAVAPVASARKIPQWVFVTHLFNDVLLKDRIAMAASGFSTRISMVRRALLAAACVLLLLLVALVFNSWLGNRDLQRTVREAAAALPAQTTPEPSLTELRQLERLRSVVATLDQYRREGAPLSLRWGLYSGDDLYPDARQLYFSRFNALLLSNTQARLLETLLTLPPTPDATHDYTMVYATLKAYLITTSHHEKSDRAFLAPVLYGRWAATREVEEERAQLVHKQFEFYAQALTAENPFSATTDNAAIEKARAYLRGFGDEERIYQSALAEASKTEPINFNRQYPGSDKVVVSRTIIPGAFTKSGFTTAQNRFNHLKDELGKEEWVVGAQAYSGSTADLEARLRQRYSTEFVTQWRTFLSTASVRSYAGYGDAANKLELLTTPSYPLLALFALVSDNTNVSAAEISTPFQPVRTVVPPSVPSPVQSSNQPYLNILGGLQSSMKQASLAPPNDPAAAAQALSAVTTAYNAPREMAQKFQADEVNHLDKIVLGLLEQPIRLAENVAKTGPAGGLNAAGQSFCSQFGRLSSKFPFNPSTTQEATIEEVGEIFAPIQGKALFDFYSGTLQRYLTRQGSQYLAPSSGAVRINPEFLRWFNSLAAFSDALYPGGSQQPRLAFSLTQPSKNRFRELSITVDGEKLSGGTKQFTWPGRKPGITVSDRGDPLITFDGPWALFRFAAEADWQGRGGAAELQFRLQTNGRQQKFADGTDKIVYYELRMNNPAVLQRAQLAGMRNCVARVAAVH